MGRIYITPYLDESRPTNRDDYILKKIFVKVFLGVCGSCSVFFTPMACHPMRVGIDLVIVLIPLCSFQGHVRCSNGGFLPVEPWDEADPSKTLASNSNKDASAGGEE